MIKQTRDSYGYKKLLVFKKADELQSETALLAAHFCPSGYRPHSNTLLSLSDQMVRSARPAHRLRSTSRVRIVLKRRVVSLGGSTKHPVRHLLAPMGYVHASQERAYGAGNIVEGWKRNSTSEYYTFLGYSIASNAELEEDCNDIIGGKYRELINRRGVMGEKGAMGTVEKLLFYPLDSHLSPIIQLKLRCKEVNFLLDRLQKSLVLKMEEDHTLSNLDRVNKNISDRNKEDKWLEQFLKNGK